MKAFEKVSSMVAFLITGFLATAASEYLVSGVWQFGKVPSIVLVLAVGFFFPSTVCLIRRVPEHDDRQTVMNMLVGLLIAAFLGIGWVVYGEEERRTLSAMFGVIMWGLLMFYPGQGAGTNSR